MCLAYTCQCLCLCSCTCMRGVCVSGIHMPVFVFVFLGLHERCLCVWYTQREVFVCLVHTCQVFVFVSCACMRGVCESGTLIPCDRAMFWA